MSFRLNVTGRGKLRRGQAHEDRPCRGLEDFVLRHRETVLRNKKERKKKGELKSGLKALIKGQEKNLHCHKCSLLRQVKFLVVAQRLFSVERNSQN